MTEISEDFVEERVDELKEMDEVKAVAVVGSYARNPSGDHNDLDIFAIVEGDWRKRVTEEIDGVVVEKFFNSESWARKYFEEDKWYMVRWMENIDVRYDSDNRFEKLKQLAEEKKESIGIEDVDEVLYTIWDMKKDLERMEDVGQKRFFMYRFFDYLVDLNYRLKEEVPVKDNYKIEKLQDFDGYMYKLAQDFLTSSSTMEKERKLNKMIENVTKNLGEPIPEWETEKELLEE